MALHDRLRQLKRKPRRTQAKPSKLVGVLQEQISAYERDVHSPSTDVLIKLAEVFDVNHDYLAFAAAGQTAQIQVRDRELLRRFELIDQLSDQEKHLAKEMLDLVGLKSRFQTLASAGV